MVQKPALHAAKTYSKVLLSNEAIVSEAIPTNESISIVWPVAKDVIHDFVEVTTRLNHRDLSTIEGAGLIDAGAILSY